MMPTTSGLTNQSTPRQPTDDIDAVLAAAYQPMDRIEVRFAECEALSAHGFVKEVRLFLFFFLIIQFKLK